MSYFDQFYSKQGGININKSGYEGGPTGSSFFDEIYDDEKRKKKYGDIVIDELKQPEEVKVEKKKDNVIIEKIKGAGKAIGGFLFGEPDTPLAQKEPDTKRFKEAGFTDDQIADFVTSSYGKVKEAEDRMLILKQELLDLKSKRTPLSYTKVTDKSDKGYSPDITTREKELENLEYEVRVYKELSGQANTNKGFLRRVSELFTKPDEFAKNVIPYVRNVKELHEFTDLAKTENKLKEGVPLTNEEKSLVKKRDAKVIEAYLSKGWGDMLAEAFAPNTAYLIDFALTAGVGTGISTAVKSLPAIAMAPRMIQRLVPGLAGAIAQGTVRVPVVASKAAEYMLPEYGLVAGEQGDIIISKLDEGDSFEKALGKGWGRTVFETAAERSGVIVEDSFGFMKKAMLARFGVLSTIDSPVALKRLAQATGWNGIIPEIFEEYVDKIGDTLLDGRAYELPDPTRAIGRNDLERTFPQLFTARAVEEFWLTLGVVALQGTIMNVADSTLNRALRAKETGDRYVLEIEPDTDKEQKEADTKPKSEMPTILTDEFEKRQKLSTLVQSIMSEQELTAAEMIEANQSPQDIMKEVGDNAYGMASKALAGERGAISYLIDTYARTQDQETKENVGQVLEEYFTENPTSDQKVMYDEVVNPSKTDITPEMKEQIEAIQQGKSEVGELIKEEAQVPKDEGQIVQEITTEKTNEAPQDVSEIEKTYSLGEYSTSLATFGIQSQDKKFYIVSKALADKLSPIDYRSDEMTKADMHLTAPGTSGDLKGNIDRMLRNGSRFMGELSEEALPESVRKLVQTKPTEKLDKLQEQLKDLQERKKIFAKDEGLGIDNTENYNKLIEGIKKDIADIEGGKTTEGKLSGTFEQVDAEKLNIVGKTGPFYWADTLDWGTARALHGKRFADEADNEGVVTVYRSGKEGEELEAGRFFTADKKMAKSYMKEKDTQENFGGTKLYTYDLFTKDLVSIDNLDFSELVYMPRETEGGKGGQYKDAEDFIKKKKLDPDSVYIKNNESFIVENEAGDSALLTELPLSVFGSPQFETLNQNKYKPGRKIKDPIEVTLSDGELIITDGANRFTQALSNKDDTIPVILSVQVRGKPIKETGIREAVEAWLPQSRSAKSQDTLSESQSAQISVTKDDSTKGKLAEINNDPEVKALDVEVNEIRDLTPGELQAPYTKDDKVVVLSYPASLGERGNTLDTIVTSKQDITAQEIVKLVNETYADEMQELESLGVISGRDELIKEAIETARKKVAALKAKGKEKKAQKKSGRPVITEVNGDTYKAPGPKTIYKKNSISKGTFDEGNLEGKKYTTDLFIMELADIDVGKFKESTSSYRVNPYRAQKFIDDLSKQELYPIPATPVEYAKDTEAVRFKGENVSAAFGIEYYNYLAKKYPDAEFKTNKQGTILSVFKDGELVASLAGVQVLNEGGFVPITSGVDLTQTIMVEERIQTEVVGEGDKKDKDRLKADADETILLDDETDNRATDEGSRSQEIEGALPDTTRVGEGTPGDTQRDTGITGDRGISGGSPVRSNDVGDGSRTSVAEQIGEIIAAHTSRNSTTGAIDIESPITAEQRRILEQYTPAGGKEKAGATGKGLLDEYYTPQGIVNAMWEMVRKYVDLNTESRVLEPSGGTGRFIDNVSLDFNVDVLEINNDTARIAKLLHPNANVFNKPLETLFITERGQERSFDQTYDVVIGNPPYGEHRGKYLGLGEEAGIKKYEEYFIKRALDLTKKDGVVAMIVPSGILRSTLSKSKERIAALGSLISAHRMPNGAFDSTDIGTDILLFRKDPTSDETEIYRRTNKMSNDNYFVENKDKILGDQKMRKGKFGEEAFVEGSLSEALDNLANREGLSIEEPVAQESPAPVISNGQAPSEQTFTDKPALETVERAPVPAEVKRIVDKNVTHKNDKKGKTMALSQNPDANIELWQNTDALGRLKADYMQTYQIKDLTQFVNNDISVDFEDGDTVYYSNFMYEQGNIYEKLDTLEANKGKLNEKQYARQKAALEVILPKRATTDKLNLQPTSDFIRGIELTEQGGLSAPITDMFYNWMYKLPRDVFEDSSGYEVEGYLDGTTVNYNDKLRNAEIRKRRRRVGNKLFKRFIDTELTDAQRQQVEEAYNRAFNALVRPDYSKVPLFAPVFANFKGKPLTVKPVQLEGVSFLSTKGVGLLAYDVGWGKTMTGILAINEAMHRGNIKRPLVVVPNAVYLNWISEIQQLIPNVRINLLDNLGRKFKGDLKKFKVENGTISIMTYEGLNRLGFKPETYEKLTADLKDTLKDPGKKSKRAQEKEDTKAETVMGKAMKGTTEDVFFEDMNFDHITIDEVHNFKNIFTGAKVQKEGGARRGNEYRNVIGSSSARGVKAYFMTQYILGQNEGRNVHLLSATPFTNSPLEIYSIISLMGKKRLETMGLKNVNEFMSMFMDLKPTLVVKADQSVQEQDVVENFINLQQLQKLVTEYIDFRTGDEAAIKRPNKDKRTVMLKPTSEQADMIEYAEELMTDKTKDGGVIMGITELQNITLSPYISRYARAGKQVGDVVVDDLEGGEKYVALDEGYKAFVEGSPKIKYALEVIKQNKKDGKGAGQVIFMPRGKDYFQHVKDYLVKEVKYKSTEIDIIEGGMSLEKKANIQNEFNKGNIKVLIGTSAIKEGVNLQENATDLFYLHLPWNPTDMLQVEGRIWRQGNKWANVRIHYPLIENTVDAFMFQKLETKEKRLKNLWNYKGDSVEVGDLDFEEMKMDLISNPVKRAEAEKLFVKARESQKLAVIKSDLAFLKQIKKKDTENKEDLEYAQRRLDEAKKDENTTNFEFYSKRVDKITAERASFQRALEARKIDIAQVEVDILEKEKAMKEQQSKVDGIEDMYKSKIEQAKAEYKEQTRVPEQNDYAAIVEKIKQENQSFFVPATEMRAPSGTASKMDYKPSKRRASFIPSLETDIGDGSVIVEVESFGRKEYVPLLENYKGYDIVMAGKDVSVWDNDKKTLFRVALDDSKSSGNRFIDETANTVENAKEYIDWFISSRTEQKKKLTPPSGTASQLKRPTDYSLSEPYISGSYTRQDIMAGQYGIGHISYRVEKETLIVDMIKIDDRRRRNKGYAGSALADVMKKTKTKNIVPTEDGYTRQGRDFIRQFSQTNELKAPSGTASKAEYDTELTRQDRDAEIYKGMSAQVIEMPEMVALAKEIYGSVPTIKKLSGKWGDFSGRTGIRLNPDIFKDTSLASKVLAHEIGHLIDFQPEGDMSRGNIVGRIATLHKFLKSSFSDEQGNINNKDIRTELKNLTMKWAPFDPNLNDKYTKYRYSSRELYAEAISVLFNDPGMLKREAPKFFSAFFDRLDKKPDVYNVLQETYNLVVKGQDTLLAEREKAIDEMFKKGDDKFIALSYEQADKTQDYYFKLKYDLIDKNQKVIDDLKRAQKAGKKIAAEDNPVYMLEEMNYVGGVIKDFVVSKIQPIYNNMRKAGIRWADFGKVLFLERAATERAELANPLGITKEAAELQLEKLRRDMGEAQYEILQKNIRAFREAIKSKLDDAHYSGYYSTELVNELRANPSYATYQVLDYMGVYISPRVKKQIGTFKDIANPADATIQKTISLIKAIELNRAKAGLVSFYKKNSKELPNEITEAKYVWGGKSRIPVEPDDKKLGLITVFENGKLRGYYVDKYIAETVKYTSVGHVNIALSVLRFLNNKLYRPLFITFNTGFQTFNAVRDFNRFWKNTPNLPLYRAFLRYGQAVAPAFRDAFTGIPDKTIQEMERLKILSVTANDIFAGKTDIDTQIDAIMARYGTFSDKKKFSLFAPIRAVLSLIERTGNFIERLPKVAAYMELNGKLPSAELGSFIRTKTGSPDFLRRGAAYSWSNEVYLFSNAIKEGIRSDIEVATSPQTRGGFWFKTAVTNIAPKIIMFMALQGLFGDELRKMFEKVSEYDMSNYTIIPMGVDENGRLMYLRIPQDETGRFMGAIMWKSLRVTNNDQTALQNMTDLFSIGAGQLPSFSPTITTGLAILQYVSGQNPYDFFRGRNVIPDQVFKAGPEYTLKPFATWVFGQLGGSTFIKTYVSEQMPSSKTWAQKVLEAPILSNVVGRWIKVSDYGEIEKARQLELNAEQKKAQDSIETKRTIREAVKEYFSGSRDYDRKADIEYALVRDIIGRRPITTEEKRKATDIKKKFRVAVVSGDYDTMVERFFTAGSNDEKMLYLEKIKDSRSSDEFADLIAVLRREGLLSNDMQKRLRKLR